MRPLYGGRPYLGESVMGGSTVYTGVEYWTGLPEKVWPPHAHKHKQHPIY